MERHGRDGGYRGRILSNALLWAFWCRGIGDFLADRSAMEVVSVYVQSRIERLERAFASDDFSDITPFQVYKSWFETLQEEGFGVPRNFRLGIVAFPHVVTFVAGIVLFVLHALGWIAAPYKS